MTQIRVHELASELKVGTEQVLTILVDVGQKVRGPSTVIGVSAAAKVRSRLRLAHSATPRIPPQRPAAMDDRGAHGDDVVASVEANVRRSAPSTPAPDPVMAVEQSADAPGSLLLDAPQAALFVAPAPVSVDATGSAGLFANPFAAPAPKSVRTSARPVGQVPVAPGPAGKWVSPVPLVLEPEPSLDALWRARGISASDQRQWLEAGLRPAEAEVADRCRSAAIAPEELSGKLSGRTALQRLRDGEAVTSVWARIREAEQQPRRAGTKLTGRFELN